MIYTTRNVTLGSKGIDLLRPYAIRVVQEHISNTQDYESVYEAHNLADAFSISPRDAGFDFETWREWAETRNKTMYPSYDSGPKCSVVNAPGMAAWH